MIQYTLVCGTQHSFDAWFKNADAYDSQAKNGLLACPICNSSDVTKALMAPAIGKNSSSDQTPKAEHSVLSAGHPKAAEIRQALKDIRAKAVENADYVGNEFAEQARKMHFNEAPPRGIYGEATRDELADLADDGISFMPLPTLPDEKN